MIHMQQIFHRIESVRIPWSSDMIEFFSDLGCKSQCQTLHNVHADYIILDNILNKS
jgi:hypothetical protein